MQLVKLNNSFMYFFLNLFLGQVRGAHDLKNTLTDFHTGNTERQYRQIIQTAKTDMQ